MKKKSQKPELLMPAGSFENLKAAFMFGADAVYMGSPKFSLRTRQNDAFDNVIEKSIKYTHKIGKKIYITLNLYPHNQKIPDIIEHIKFLRKLSPDAIIFSDPGIYNLLKKYYPEAELHLSVQATATNYETVNFWKKQGIKRVILARELSLKEISEINKKCPDVELEAFVHGAICMSYSGRCLLSSYLTGRDANQGDCAHTCRWNYKVYALEEALRPGNFMPIEEDEHGSHILSSRDMCLVEHINKLIKSGIVSLKIEGRNKNINYVATITKAYRQAIDDAALGKKFDKKLLKEVHSVSNRGFFTGFYFDKPKAKDHQLDANRTEGTHDFIGIIREFDKKTMLATVECKGQIKIGDDIEIVTPDKIIKQKVVNLYNHAGNKINIYHPGVEKPFLLKLNHKVEKLTIIRKML